MALEVEAPTTHATSADLESPCPHTASAGAGRSGQESHEGPMNQIRHSPAGAPGPARCAGLLSQLIIASVLGACVAPNVVVVDQKTALERQAAGDYPALQNELEQAGMAPAPEAFTR